MSISASEQYPFPFMSIPAHSFLRASFSAGVSPLGSLAVIAAQSMPSPERLAPNCSDARGAPPPRFVAALRIASGDAARFGFGAFIFSSA